MDHLSRYAVETGTSMPKEVGQRIVLVTPPKPGPRIMVFAWSELLGSDL